MEKDKQLKEILLHSAEGASADFTDRVMKKVHDISATYYQPLVSPGLKKRFIFVFVATVAAIFGLCLLIALADPNVMGWIKSIPVPGVDYNKVLLFILIFWTLFALNTVVQKTFRLNRNP